MASICLCWIFWIFFVENRATFLTLLGSHFLGDDEDDSILMFLFMPHVRKTQLYEMRVDYAPCWGQKHYCNSVKMMNMFISITASRLTQARQPYRRVFLLQECLSCKLKYYEMFNQFSTHQKCGRSVNLPKPPAILHE